MYEQDINLCGLAAPCVSRRTTVGATMGQLQHLSDAWPKPNTNCGTNCTHLGSFSLDFRAYEAQ